MYIPALSAHNVVTEYTDRAEPLRELVQPHRRLSPLCRSYIYPTTTLQLGNHLVSPDCAADNRPRHSSAFYTTFPSAGTQSHRGCVGGYVISSCHLLTFRPKPLSRCTREIFKFTSPMVYLHIEDIYGRTRGMRYPSASTSPPVDLHDLIARIRPASLLLAEALTVDLLSIPPAHEPSFERCQVNSSAYVCTPRLATSAVNPQEITLSNTSITI
ncbi:hypothetical protein B0J18DRAFT_95923 [Chaetomium sp. MPI-SDFR-AT-0129]|nr:hypothetical protein B0J18DRAFT_95923 [Chaetomium sp. MPI-SDFR-AT-0129]